jgi:decaprenylphospho-beta-D-erythro-pentofuranosid-2-ulose 2-reductase
MNILILGGNSDMAYALAKSFAEKDHASMVLASRDMESLEKRVKDLRLRYLINAEAVFFDAVNYSSHADFYHSLKIKPDIVIVAFGYFGNQLGTLANFQECQKIIDINFTGAASILEIVASDFESRQKGCIVAISSVAGCRGRKANAMYGAAKAALTSYLSALRQRLSPFNIQVLTVLPGFVATKMTEQFPIPKFLLATPEKAALDIYNAVKHKRNIIYTVWYWRWIMAVVKLIPESIFKRMNF